MRIGFGSVDITPRGSVPMAGYFHLEERMSEGVRDPLFARTMVFDDGDELAVLVVLDLLFVPPPLVDGVKVRLAHLGATVLVHATHTHSGYGGLWDNLPSRLMMGNYRPELVQATVDAVVEAVDMALADREEATVGTASARLPGHNGNRRDPAGPVDEDLQVMAVDRGDRRSLVVSYPAHPVIVGERDHRVLSADFPGEVVKLLAAEGFEHVVFVNGPVGGVDVLFPDDEKVTADENIRMMVDPLVALALEVADDIVTDEGVVRGSGGRIPLGPVDSNPFHDDQPLRALFYYPLRLALYGLFLSAQVDGVDQNAIRVGDALFIGGPADLGVGIALELKAFARERGIRTPFVMSQSDGYIGYLHRPMDYRHTPPDEQLSMARYENAMAIFGHGSGQLVEDHGKRLVERVTSQPR